MAYRKRFGDWVVESTEPYIGEVRQQHAHTILFKDKSKVELISGKITLPTGSTNVIRIQRLPKERKS
jgi:hypothetical protein